MTTTVNNEHKNIKVPNLRFPEFQGEWISKTIGDIAPLQRGFDLPTGQICNGKIPVVYSNGIMNHHSSYKCVAPGLVTGRSGTIGKFTYIEDGYYWPHNTSLWVTDFHDNNPKFIHYLYQTIHIEQYSTGSGVPTLNRNYVHRHKTFIPKLKEQNKIAAFLSLLDERIATQNKIIDKLQSLIKGIRNDVFGKLRKNIGFNAVVGDVLDYEQPQSYIVEDTEYTNEGTPVLTANKAFVLGYTSETNGIYDKGDCIIFDDFTLDCKYVDFPFKVKSSAIKILTAKNKELLRYTFEFLKYLDLSTEEHKRHYIAETQNQEIILPTEQMVKTIAHIFSTLSLRMETAVKQRNVFEKQKQYLLRQMFI